MSLDATLDEVQNSRFRNIYNQLVKQYEKKSQFNEVELFCILMVYHKFALRNGIKAKYITKKQLANIFEVFFKISEVFTVERITSIIAKDTKKEIDPIGWLNLFEVFMTNDLEAKMKFCFQVYDFHGVGGLNREVVTKYVEKFFKSDDEDEAGELVVSMLDLLFKKFDIDKDGIISFEDYSSVVRQQPLLLEFLGSCMPEISNLTTVAYCSNILTKITDFDKSSE